MECAERFRIMVWKIHLSFVIEILLFFTFDVYGSGVTFSNTWAVKIRGGGIEKIARKHGFVNETQVRGKWSSPLFKVVIFKCREKGGNMGAREKYNTVQFLTCACALRPRSITKLTIKTLY